jgi:hypothetical protein
MMSETNWAVYIEGMCLPWEDGLTEEQAKEYEDAFWSNGVRADATQTNHMVKRRCGGRNVK